MSKMRFYNLQNLTNGNLVSQKLRIADDFFSRLRGLLGTAQLPVGEMLLITRCNSIHTFFMLYTIDCIFMDKEKRVVAIKKNINPWRFVLPILKASSVIELASGQLGSKHLMNFNVKVGDQLHVGN